MRRQKKKQNGITLIALVISIIVMLILAGVSLNATVGENGIITMAQKAKELSQKANELENLQMALAGYSIESYDNQAEALDAIVNGLFAKEYIDWVDGTKDDIENYIDYNQYEDENGSLYMWVKKGDNSYRIFLNNDDTYTVDEMPLSGGGNLMGGTYMVTKEAFSNGEGISDPKEKGKFTIEGDTKVVFTEPLGVQDDGITANGEMLSIYVKKDSKVKIYFNANNEEKASDGITYYKLINQGISRSAIDIENGAELEIVVGKNVNVSVDSGFGTDAERATGKAGSAGIGGFAGIHVPERATLILKGNGELSAIGGNASKGSDAIEGDIGGSGGGGAGAGIGGQGGYGGTGGGSNLDETRNGGDGENCGNVMIFGDLTVNAYGGAGGSSGTLTGENKKWSGSGTGAGGYPAAGIGGRRSWWRSWKLY